MFACVPRANYKLGAALSRLFSTEGLIYKQHGSPASVLGLQHTDVPVVGPNQALVEFLAVRHPYITLEHLMQMSMRTSCDPAGARQPLRYQPN